MLAIKIVRKVRNVLREPYLKDHYLLRAIHLWKGQPKEEEELVQITHSIQGNNTLDNAVFGQNTV